MTGEPLIHASDAVLAYGPGEPALARFSLELGAGELAILLGPNGGGKTTFLRALAGELAPAAGSLGVAGAVAYLPQRDVTRTDFPVSALDVVLMGTLAERRIWQRAGRPERARALAALERVGLGDAADRTYGELSGGQRRRVLLARTTVGGQPIVALDEPLAGVDPRSAAIIREALDQLRDEGRLVIEASHDIEHARTADRVICMAGRIVAAGPPANVLTATTLRETYAADLAVIPAGDGRTLVTATDDCAHDHAARA
jgi:ABC-type Mn2+/Zn2+ transport system ATPase subunit